jgi:hypothetical protein
MDTTKAKALVKNIVADADTIDALITDNARLEKEVADVSVKLRMRETELGNVKSREEFYRAQTEALSDGINAHAQLDRHVRDLFFKPRIVRDQCVDRVRVRNDVLD